MKEMSEIYYKMPTDKLRRLKSKKYVEWEKLANKMGYLDIQEKRKLIKQIHWIDVVLAARGLQKELF